MNDARGGPTEESDRTHRSVYQTVEEARGSGLYRHRGITLVRGRGVTVWDERGRSYLDCTSSFGVACLGHAHPELVRVLSVQAATLATCSGA